MKNSRMTAKSAWALAVCIGGILAVGGCGRGSSSEGGKAAIRHPGYQQDDLWRAVSDGKPERVARLVEDGADVNARTSAGETALALAVKWNQRSIVRLLLERSKVEVDLPDDQGVTPLMLAVAPDPFEIEKLNQDNAGGPLLFSSTLFAKDHDRRPFATAEELLKAGADPSARDRSGKTPIMYARTEEKIRLLVAAGAKPNAEDGAGNTALMNALSECNPTALVALLELGSKADQPNSAGLTARRFFVKLAEQDRGEASRDFDILASSEDHEKQEFARRRLECFEQAQVEAIISSGSI